MPNLDRQFGKSNVVIIDDDYVIRFLVKQLLLHVFQKNSLDIYSSADGLEGLGYLFVTNPNIIIVDTTLPKYDGLEIVNYISSNKEFNQRKIKTIVLTNDQTKPANLPDHYKFINKSDPDFIEKLIDLVKDQLEEQTLTRGLTYKKDLFKKVTNFILKIANASDLSAIKGDKLFFIFGFFYKLKWLILQLFMSPLLSIYFILFARKDKDLNVKQRNSDFNNYRIRTYPAFGLVLATLIIFLTQAFIQLGTIVGLFHFASQSVLAASYTWDGGGLTSNWSDCDNWNTNVCPVAADTVTFDGTSTKNSIIDNAAASSITIININSGYTGTITLSRSLSVTGSFTQAAGNFTAGANTLDIAAFTLNSGANFTASSATTTVSGNLTFAAGSTFNHNNGRLSISGNAATIACNSAVFYTVQISTAGTKTINSDCSLPLGNTPAISGAGSLILNGTLSGSGTLSKTSATFTMNSGSTLSGFSGSSFSSFTVAGANADLSALTSFAVSSTLTLNSGTLTLPNNADLNSAFVFSGGTFNAPSGNLFLAGNLTVSGSAVFNHNLGTVVMDGGNATWSCNNVTFNKIALGIFSAQITNNKIINADCTLPLGANPMVYSGFTITVNGSLSGSGTLTRSSGSFTMNTGSTLVGFSSMNIGGLTVAGANLDFSSYNPITFGSALAISSGSLTIPSGTELTSTFSLSGGTFNAPSGTFSIAQSFTVSGSGVFNHNNGTIIFKSGTLNCNNVVFNQVSLQNAGLALTINSNCSLPLGSNPTIPITAGLTLNGSLSGSGSLSKTSGSFVLNSGAILSGFNTLELNSLTVSGATANFASYSGFSTTSTVTLNSGSLNLPNGSVIGNGLTIAGGTFTAPSGDLHLGGSLTISGTPVFNHNNGNLIIQGASTSTINCDNITLNTVSFNIAGNKTIATTCNLNVGANPVLAGSGSIILNGTLTGSGLLTINPALTLSSTAQLIGFGNRIEMPAAALTLNSGATLPANFTELVAKGLNIAGGNLDASNFAVFEINWSFTMSAGTFTAPAVMDVSRHFTISGGTFNHNNGVVNFVLEGNLPATLSCKNIVFNLVTINKNDDLTIQSNCNLPLGNNPTVTSPNSNISGTLSGSGKITFSAGSIFLNSTAQLVGFSELTTDYNSALNITGLNLDLTSYTLVDLNGFLTINSGTLIAPDSMTLYGDIDYLGGVFNANNGSIILDGEDQVLNATAGDLTFHNLSKLADSSNTLMFAESTTYNFTGQLTLKGTASNYLKLRSSTDGNPWQINLTGTSDLQYLDVKDSNNTSANAIALNSQGLNSGNNTNWDFGRAQVNSLAPNRLVSGKIVSDKRPTFSFNIADPDLTDPVQFRIQIDNNSNFNSPELDYTSAAQMPGTFSFRVGQNLNGGTYTSGNIKQQLADGKYYLRIGAIDVDSVDPTYLTANQNKIAFILDTTAPNGSIQIIDDPDNSDTFAVILNIAGEDLTSGISKMMIAESSDFDGATWQNYASQLSYNFAATYTTHSIYLKFLDLAGISSATYSDAITFVSPPDSEEQQNPPIVVDDGSDDQGEIDDPIDPVTPDQSYTLVLNIVDLADMPLDGVSVALYIEETNQTIEVVSAEDGIATFNNVTGQNYTVKFSYDEQSVSQPIIIDQADPQKPINLKITLQKEGPQTNYFLITSATVLLVIILTVLYILSKKKHSRQI